MFDKDISVAEEDVFVLEEIGKLAVECLEEEVEDRPDMKEVAEQLLMLRREEIRRMELQESPSFRVEKPNCRRFHDLQHPISISAEQRPIRLGKKPAPAAAAGSFSRDEAL